MSRHPPHPTSPGTEVPALAVALEENKSVEARVEGAASDLAAAGAELRERLASGATLGAAQVALKVGEEIEDKVKKCADDLHEVNATLAQGVTALERTEQALAAAQAELVDAKSALESAQAAERDALLEASRDAATGLPNREHFNGRLTHDIAVAARHGFELAVMFFDLDEFKRINDTHGHAAGDEVLKQVAARLLQYCRSEDTVCRTGGDEFIYVLIDPHGRANIERIASALFENLTRPVAFGDVAIPVRASIGIALYPEHATAAAELIAHADLAMYCAKKRRPAPGWVFYDESLRTAA